jgi:hypothetical protein
MKRLFSKATLPGWALLLLSQLRWLYSAVDAWSNVEFLADKIRGLPSLAVPISLLTSAWFQVTLIFVGLGWIALATSAWPSRLTPLRSRRHPTSMAETEEEVVYTIRRSLADQIADLQRERRAETFLLIQDDRGTREYLRQEVDKLTLTQREKLFAADPEMPSWWRGKSPRTGGWPLFRVKGGIWISKIQIDQTPEKYHFELFQGIPGLLDWF